MLDVQRFMEQYKNVVEWNAVARGNVHDFSQDSITRQAEYTRSEILETLKAITTQDPVEFLDGVADVFVTLTYKHFLAVNGDDESDLISMAVEFLENEGRTIYKDTHAIDSQLLDTTVWIRRENDHDVTDTSTLYGLIELMELTQAYYNVDIFDVIKHVMDSNWSKYPSIAGLVEFQVQANIDHEVEYITKKNPDFKDIVGTVNQEHQVVVYRADNGKGKILKPSTFWNANCVIFLKEELE